MITTFPGFVPPIARLFDLANSPTDRLTFRAACEAIAPLDARTADDNLWQFPLDPSGLPQILVGSNDARIEALVLSIAWWTTADPDDHDPDEASTAERAEFDRLYAEALVVTVAALGPPRREGIASSNGYRYAFWRGRTGLLALQQSNYDCQFGEDINYWIKPRPEDAPDPVLTGSFIDWLTLDRGDG